MTNKEKTIVELIKKGFTQSEIARTAQVNGRTVKKLIADHKLFYYTPYGKIERRRQKVYPLFEKGFSNMEIMELTGENNNFVQRCKSQMRKKEKNSIKPVELPPLQDELDDCIHALGYKSCSEYIFSNGHNKFRSKIMLPLKHYVSCS